jgi:hypothetical protein
MSGIATEIEIEAPAARVWTILTDFAAYPAWNPFVRSISGPKEAGATLAVTVQPAGGRAMSLKPRLLVFREPEELRWRGRVLFPGVFDGEHHFRILELEPGRVRFQHGERFTGLLVPLVMRGNMRRGTEAGFLAMNRALKDRAESAA